MSSKAILILLPKKKRKKKLIPFNCMGHLPINALPVSK